MLMRHPWLWGSPWSEEEVMGECNSWVIPTPVLIEIIAILSEEVVPGFTASLEDFRA